MSGMHSVLSPSSAHRWFGGGDGCAGSVAMCRDVPDSTSQPAAFGTAYHQISSQALIEGVNCADFIGTIVYADGYEFMIDEENAAYAQIYVDNVRAEPGEMIVEGSIDTSPVLGVPDQRGTLDVITLDYEALTIRVRDLKMGTGRVYAANNDQLRIYALAALHEYSMLADWKRVIMTIDQPRLGWVDSWDIVGKDYNDLLRQLKAVDVATVAKITHDIYERNDPAEIARYLEPSDKNCEWCPVRTSCKARLNQLADVFPVLEALMPGVQLTASDEWLAELLTRARAIDQLVEDLHKEAYKRAMAGKKLIGSKLVAGRKGDRKWKDPSKAVQAMWGSLGNSCVTPISPAAAEKLLTKLPAVWASIQEHIKQDDGKPSLVPADDPRPEYDAHQISLNAFDNAPGPSLI